MSRLVIRKKETPKMYVYQHKHTKNIVMIKPVFCSSCPLKHECESRYLGDFESILLAPFDDDAFKAMIDAKLYVSKNCPLEEIEVHLALNDKEPKSGACGQYDNRIVYDMLNKSES